ncbi:neuroendocrine convertase 2-like [Patiria miniata]|uniref:Neuroendocrine convertase 2 n=1 Tax=Patiria miniata TaxID=46514 RepID=A0A914BB19_PATMI|nr:neuroendocrine convertase 2-like [Patiria miniata]
MVVVATSCGLVKMLPMVGLCLIAWAVSGIYGARDDVYTNSFLVEMRDGAGEAAHSIAKRHAFEYRGTVLGQDNLHHFVHKRSSPHAHRRRRSTEHVQTLEAEPMIKRVIQQTGFKRDKRGFKDLHQAFRRFRREVAAKTTSTDTGGESGQDKDTEKSWTDFNDPLIPKQWFLKNTGQANGKKGLDLNVEAAWKKGYTGKGVTIAIMDDGIDYMHDDLAPNFNLAASFDYSSNDAFPYPRYTDDWFNSHGTRCAGEVSAVANNGICGVGIAYNSKIAGIRMLDQPFMTDLIEASSMRHEPQLIDIYSASWGPQDNGKTVDGPRDLTLEAIADGVNKGRGGKGSIYVWASGDGGPNDDCNCDGYASSMWTISINSAINDGRTALYDESCSSTLASTFSNGRNRHPEAGVATTDLYGNCTLAHSGTSAAAPEAAGVFALALEANPSLTWRDIQHLTVLTSKRNQLYDDNYQWQCNGVGLEFNHLFGFGVLDAGAMVELAEKWKTVPERFHCSGATYKGVSQVPDGRSGEKLVLRLTTDACDGQDNMVNYLEHTQAIITLNSTRRGDVTIYLTSPMGTHSILLSERPADEDVIDGFQRWPFMTSHTWGEDPRGEWVLEVAMADGSPHVATLTEWTLVLHGTKEGTYIEEAKSKSSCNQAVLEAEKEQEIEEKEQRKLEQSQAGGNLDLGQEVELLEDLEDAINKEANQELEDEDEDETEGEDDILEMPAALDNAVLPPLTVDGLQDSRDIPEAFYYPDGGEPWYGENEFYGEPVGQDPWDGWTDQDEENIDWKDPDIWSKLGQLFEEKYGQQKYPYGY